jgi:hypothetical protein
VVEKPEWKRPLGKHKRRWTDNIKVDLKEAGCGGVGCVNLFQDTVQLWTLVKTIMNLEVNLPLIWLSYAHSVTQVVYH